MRIICLSLWFSIGFSLLFTIKANATEDSTYIVSSVKVYNEANDDSSVTANLIVGNAFEVYEAVNDDSGTVWYLISTDFGAAGTLTVSSSVNLRSEPNAASDILAMINEGTELVYYGVYENDEGEGWYEVESDDLTGYITESVVELVTEAADQEETEVNQSTQAAEVQNIQEQTEEQTDSEFEVSGENAQTVKKSKSGFRIDLAAIGLIAGVLLCIAAIAVLIRKILKLLRL